MRIKTKKEKKKKHFSKRGVYFLFNDYKHNMINYYYNVLSEKQAEKGDGKMFIHWNLQEKK